MKKLFQENSLLWIALALALFGSLTHVAWSFSTLEGGDLRLGYVQAVAVDVGLFAIAVGIQRARREGRRTWGLWGGVIFFAFISTYANLLHGLIFSSDLYLPGFNWLIALRPLLLSAVLPIMVIYLAEVAAARLRHKQKSDTYTKDEELPIPLEIKAGVFLDRWFSQHKREPIPPEMVEHFERATGEAIDAAQADTLILEWRAKAGRVGARPSTPTPGAPVLNGRG